MPIAPQRPCSAPGCGALTDAGRCPKHANAAEQLYEHARGSASRRGYGRRWQEASKGFLRVHPLCQCGDCDEGRKRVTIATVVDHIVAHRGDMSLFWNQANWQAMSKPCHDRKTATEDGGLGNERKGRGG